MDAIGLRPATPDDFEFFFELHRQTLGPYVDRVWGWIDEDQRAYLQRTIDIDTTRVVVVDGADAGRLNIDHRDGDVYIGLIEIAPRHQGCGIGGSLIRRVLDAAFAEGKGVRLHVLAVNEGAGRLYRRLGFREVGREGKAPEVRIQMRAHPRSSAIRAVPTTSAGSPPQAENPGHWPGSSTHCGRRGT
ncbi:GNAT family N-acetyltransferase [Mycolicibacterium litorale]|uniref:GNAT family N-acetyltransferase n=1 Tax=Mycolicibacterium litorale TaxID=758802 RepID=UPI003CF0E512